MNALGNSEEVGIVYSLD